MNWSLAALMTAEALGVVRVGRAVARNVAQ